MKVVRKSCLRGALEAEGTAVIVDVFRAFSCQPLLFHFGVKRVILEADPVKATILRRDNPEFILVGEVNGVPMVHADCGNSPSEIILKGEQFFKDRTVIHRTTSGVAGAIAAREKASEVILVSFVNARAAADYIKREKPYQVTLVAMGERGKESSPEDEACVDYLEYLLKGSSYDAVKAFKDVVFHHAAQKFIQGTKDYLPREDPAFCLQRDIFDFVLRLECVEGRDEVTMAP